jgi:hypothetical protein
MNETLHLEVAKYLFPFYSNLAYNNCYYYNFLIKKYGKKEVKKAIKKIQEKNCITDAFS